MYVHFKELHVLSSGTSSTEKWKKKREEKTRGTETGKKAQSGDNKRGEMRWMLQNKKRIKELDYLSRQVITGVVLKHFIR